MERRVLERGHCRCADRNRSFIHHHFTRQRDRDGVGLAVFVFIFALRQHHDGDRRRVAGVRAGRRLCDRRLCRGPDSSFAIRPAYRRSEIPRRRQWSCRLGHRGGDYLLRSGHGGRQSQLGDGQRGGGHWFDCDRHRRRHVAIAFGRLFQRCAAAAESAKWVAKRRKWRKRRVRWHSGNAGLRQWRQRHRSQSVERSRRLVERSGPSCNRRRSIASSSRP